MKFKEGLVGLGLSVTGLSAVGCADNQPVPVAVMNVNCDRVPSDAYILSLNALDVPRGTEEVEIVIDDQQERMTVHIQLLGRTSINGREMQVDDAGEVLEELPTAQLIAGVPAPFADEFYSSEDGLTLVCNGADIEDIRLYSSGN